MRGRERASTDAVEIPDLQELRLLSARALRVIRGQEPLGIRARESLEQELIDALEAVAPAYHASPEYCEAAEALSELHLSIRSERLRVALEEEDETRL
jgi:hypothetical protein